MKSASPLSQMNVYKPLIGVNLLNATELLIDGMRRFSHHCLAGAEPRRDRISGHLSQVQYSSI